MFDRVLYKQTAKEQLAGRWTLCVMGITYILSMPTMLSSMKNLMSTMKAVLSSSSYTAIRSVHSSGNLLLIFAGYFITGTTIIAQCYMYQALYHTTGGVKFQVFLRGFSMWMQGFLGYLWFLLWTFLWSLLFMIPGIVKAFSYSQMFWILAENPGISVRKAMNLSKVMTRGYKGELFVMLLSFIGWNILAALTFGVLYVWLIPYMRMSMANAYHALRAQALRTGVLTEADFQ